MSIAGIDKDAIATPVVVPPALEAIGMSKSFGSVSALDNVSLVLERGTVHALLGDQDAGTEEKPSGVHAQRVDRSARGERGGHQVDVGIPADLEGEVKPTCIERGAEREDERVRDWLAHFDARFVGLTE